MRVPHPFPYQGSKRLLAQDIIRFIPQDTETLYEPFAGSAAITLAVAAKGYVKKFIIGDLNKALILLWNAIINTPELITQQYKDIWHGQLGREIDYYNEIRDSFNKTGRPDLFLFLLVRCVKAAVRYNSNGEFNQSADKRRRGTKPEAIRREILATSALLRGKTECQVGHYMDVIDTATPKDVVYMDPPYQGVSSNRNSRYLEGLAFDDFVLALENLNSRQISYIVSYDGRTGSKEIGRKLPDFLNLKHVELLAGRSSQATLLGRTDETYESLYISSALQKRLNSTRNFECEEIKQMEIVL